MVGRNLESLIQTTNRANLICLKVTLIITASHPLAKPLQSAKLIDTVYFGRIIGKKSILSRMAKYLELKHIIASAKMSAIIASHIRKNKTDVYPFAPV